MKVAILISEKANLFEVGCMVELFCIPRPEFSDWYQAEVISFSSDKLKSTGGLQLATKQVTSLSSYDMLLIPSWSVKNPRVDNNLAKELKLFHAAGKRMVSFCSGAFLMAEMGFFDGKFATTHWLFANDFKNNYPKVNYVDDVLYIYDGHLGCSAGSAAALDLGIEIIRRDYGYQTANKVAKRLVLPAHRKGGQSQFVETPVLKSSNKFALALDWATENLASGFTINDLAKQANMSRRTFDRKFRSSFSMSPQNWLISQKIALAQSLLEANEGSIERIAEQAGFSNAMTMRYHFLNKLNTSPSHYQQQFKQ